MYKHFNPRIYRACGYLSMLGLKLTHVTKMDPWATRSRERCRYFMFLNFCRNRIISLTASQSFVAEIILQINTAHDLIWKKIVKHNAMLKLEPRAHDLVAWQPVQSACLYKVFSLIIKHGSSWYFHVWSNGFCFQFHGSYRVHEHVIIYVLTLLKTYQSTVWQWSSWQEKRQEYGCVCSLSD